VCGVCLWVCVWRVCVCVDEVVCREQRIIGVAVGKCVVYVHFQKGKVCIRVVRICVCVRVFACMFVCADVCVAWVCSLKTEEWVCARERAWVHVRGCVWTRACVCMCVCCVCGYL